MLDEIADREFYLWLYHTSMSTLYIRSPSERFEKKYEYNIDLEFFGVRFAEVVPYYGKLSINEKEFGKFPNLVDGVVEFRDSKIWEIASDCGNFIIAAGGFVINKRYGDPAVSPFDEGLPKLR